MLRLRSSNYLLSALLLFPIITLAEHHSGLEALLQNSSDMEYPQAQWQVAKPDGMGLSGEKIKHLFDLSFTDSATQAVVLIKDGFLVGERYAEGFDESSYGTSWSMAKSFYAALIGISIDRGEINSLDDGFQNYIDQNANRASNDELRNIAADVESYTLSLFDKLTYLSLSLQFPHRTPNSFIT